MNRFRVSAYSLPTNKFVGCGVSSREFIRRQWKSLKVTREFIRGYKVRGYKAAREFIHREWKSLKAAREFIRGYRNTANTLTVLTVYEK